jgi:hypothetical protein
MQRRQFVQTVMRNAASDAVIPVMAGERAVNQKSRSYGRSWLLALVGVQELRTRLVEVEVW